MDDSVSIVIPTFNASQTVASCLTGLANAGIRNDCIYVVDDASTDNTVEMMARDYPSINTVKRRDNGGFSAAVNTGIKATSSELVVLLNNDVEVTRGFLDTITPMFEDASVFAVSPRIILPRLGGIDEAAKTGSWHHGMFFTDQRANVSCVAPILYTTGCAAVYRRSMLDELGGFDEAYSPFYWEDTDLGYRAWKRGWKSIYQPASTVYHQHSASISKIKPAFTNTIKARNSLIFIWRNIDDAGLIAKHKRWLPLVLAKKMMDGDSAFLRGWADAFKMRALCNQKRLREEPLRKLSDREIFAMTGVDV